MTSELILLFLYLGYMALRHAIDDVRRADRASAVLALVGAVNVPIIYFSVQWWNTLHQGATVSLTAAPKMASIMLIALMLMTFAAWFYAIAVAMVRVRAIILERGGARAGPAPRRSRARAGRLLAWAARLHVWGSMPDRRLALSKSLCFARAFAPRAWLSLAKRRMTTYPPSWGSWRSRLPAFGGALSTPSSEPFFFFRRLRSRP